MTISKNKYTVVWKPDCEVNTYVTWIELDFTVHQYIDSSLWKEMIRTVVIEEEFTELRSTALQYDDFEIYAVFEGHLDCKWSNVR